MPRTECTAEQGQQWRDQYTDGYRAGRGDARGNAAPRVPLISVPPEIPGETGAEYVARYVEQAWPIGYASGYRFEAGRAPAEWFACVCGAEYRSELERDEHAGRRGCLLVSTSR